MTRVLLLWVVVAAVPVAHPAAGGDPAGEVAVRAAERKIEAGPLVEPVRDAERRGLPARLVADKVLEGLAKGVPPDRVAAVAAALVGRLAEADVLLRRVEARGPAPAADRGAALADLAQVFAAGVTPAAVDGLMAGGPAKADAVVAAATAVAALARRGVPAAESLGLGRALVARPTSAPEVGAAFDAWRAAGGREPREFLADAERRVSEGRSLAGPDGGEPPGRGARDAGRDERSRMGGEAGRPHGRRP